MPSHVCVLNTDKLAVQKLPDTTRNTNKCCVSKPGTFLSYRGTDARLPPGPCKSLQSEILHTLPPVSVVALESDSCAVHLCLATSIKSKAPAYIAILKLSRKHRGGSRVAPETPFKYGSCKASCASMRRHGSRCNRLRRKATAAGEIQGIAP